MAKLRCLLGICLPRRLARGWVAAAVERFGQVNVLFNNVGLGGSGMVTEVDEATWDRVMDVNLKSMIMACKHAVPRMAEAGGGSIINVSSIDALRAGSSRNVPYAAAKGGMISTTKVMAVHHGRDNIRVNCIAPGHLYASFPAPYLSEAERERRRRIGPPWYRGHCMGRGVGNRFSRQRRSRNGYLVL